MRSAKAAKAKREEETERRYVEAQAKAKEAKAEKERKLATYEADMLKAVNDKDAYFESLRKAREMK